MAMKMPLVGKSDQRVGIGPLSAAAAVFLIAVALVVLVHRDPGSRERLSGASAVQAALADRDVRRHLAGTGHSRERVTPIDDQLTRVTFFQGPRVVLDAAVAPDGKVTNEIVYGERYVRIGGELSQRPLMIALLCAAFFLAVAVAPLRSVRNLDVAMLAWMAVPAVLMNERLLEASVYASYPPLFYLCGRCAFVAFRPAVAKQPVVPVLEALVRSSPGVMRTRALAAGVVAAAIGLFLLAVPGGLVGDVGFASIAGATDLTHGTLPYGHLPQTELVHGDTYPLLAYAAYLPAAVVSPVRDAFDSLDGALWIATAFAIAAAPALYLAGRRLGSTGDGLRLALAWLVFPPVAIASSAGSNDMAAAACVAWAIALVLHTGRSSAALTLAAWVKLAPVLLVPAWIARARDGGRARALAGAAAVSAGVAVWILAAAGASGFGDMFDALSFQAERGSLLSLWTLTGAEAAQVVVQAALATLVVAGTFRAWRDRALAADLRRMAALGGAIVLGAQLAANYWTYAYLPWAFPLIAVALLTGGGAAKPGPALEPARRPVGHP